MGFSMPEFFHKKPSDFDPHIAANIEAVVRSGKQKYFNEFLPIFERQMMGLGKAH